MEMRSWEDITYYLKVIDEKEFQDEAAIIKTVFGVKLYREHIRVNFNIEVIIFNFS